MDDRDNGGADIPHHKGNTVYIKGKPLICQLFLQLNPVL